MNQRGTMPALIDSILADDSIPRIIRTFEVLSDGGNTCTEFA